MPSSLEDIHTIERVLAGESEAFRAIVDRYRKPILSFLYNLMGSREHVEDLGQEVFLKAYHSLAGFDAGRGAAFSTWLFAIARNACADFRRKARSGSAEGGSLPGEVEASAEDRAREARGILEDALASLPEEQRLAVEWVFIQGMSYGEAARLEGISVGTLSSRLARAKERLQRSLQGEKGA